MAVNKAEISVIKMDKIIKRLNDQGDESIAKLKEFIKIRTDWLYETLENAEILFSKPRIGSFPRTPKLTRRKGKRKDESTSKISRKSSLSKKLKLEDSVDAIPENEPPSTKELSPEIILENKLPLNEISQNIKSERLSLSRQSIRRSFRLSCKNQKRKSSIIHHKRKSSILHLKPSERVASICNTVHMSRKSIIHGNEDACSTVINATEEEEESTAICNSPSEAPQLGFKENTNEACIQQTKSNITKYSSSVKSVSPVGNDSKVEIILDTPPPNPIIKVKPKHMLTKSGKLTSTPNYGRSRQIVTSSTYNIGSKKAERVPSTSKYSYVNPVIKKTSLTPVIKTTSSFVMSAPSLKRHSPRIKGKEMEALEDTKRKFRRKSEICKKRDELLKQKIEEHKRKREERERRVQEAREQRQREIEEQNRQMEKEREERQNAVEKTKVEKLKKETIKRSQRNKQKKEAEERRKKEEEARLAKLKEQEEEQHRYQLMLERKKEYELQQKRLAQKEKEQRELEEKKQRELEEKKKQQQLKEESERQKEQERLAREKAELERIQETERKAKEEMERKKLQKEVAPSLEKSENLNTTFTKEEVQSYMITPDRSKIKKKLIDPENYDIGDLSSGDSTDDDSNPRKTIPNWAQGRVLASSVIYQATFPPNLDKIFPVFDVPDLCQIFKTKNRRFLKRTSSAVWTSPIQKHN